jgi:hypothetical protein
MAMAKSGGGIQSNKLKRVPVKAGKPSTNKVSPAAAAQLGAHLSDHITERGKVLRNPADRLLTGTMPQVPSGNDLARNVGRGGPGAGRNIYRTGTQCLHGKPVQGSPNTARRDILSEFGPERRRG